MTDIIDARWPITRPGRLPLHHQYPLLAALSRVVPKLHRSGAFGVHPIRGVPIGPGQIEITRESAVTVRTEVDQVPALLSLSGKKLDLAGYPIQLGVPQIVALAPCDSLSSHLVTIKGYMEAECFSAALRRQLDNLGIADSIHLEVGPRRVLRVKQQTIVGFHVHLRGLTVSDSLLIQAIGLGGRRHLGCGLFVPARSRLEKKDIIRV